MNGLSLAFVAGVVAALNRNRWPDTGVMMVATIGAPDIVKKLGEGQDMALIKAVETGLESRIEAMLMQCMKEICNSYARGE
mgnify:CR=1 FL=1